MERYMYMRVFIVYMHGSSLYVYASVYMCIWMDRVYMYMRVFIGVYAWIEIYVYASVYRYSMDRVLCICECL